MASQHAVAAAALAAARDEYRRPLQQLLRKAGLLSVLEPAAFNELLDHAVDCEGRPDELEPVLDALLADSGGGILTRAQVRAAVHALSGEPAAVQALHVVSAFDVPRIVYDPVAKRLLSEAGGAGSDGGGGASGGGGGGGQGAAAASNAAAAQPLSSSLLPDASYKHRVYLDRYHVLYQRLRRNKRFQPRTALAAAGVRVPGGGGGGGRDQHHQNDDDDDDGSAQQHPQNQNHHHQHVALTEIMGLKGCVGERHIVMGLLSTSEEGNFLLEDGGAAVPLDLSRSTVASGLVTENCVVVAEGEMGVDGAFHAAAAGFPSCEPRASLPATAQALDFFGGPAMTPEDKAAALAAERGARAAAADGGDAGEHRLVFLTDVALDRPGTLESLHTVLQGFSQAAAGPGGCAPAAFVLMGDFWAGGSGAAVDDAAATGGGAADGWVGCGNGGGGGGGGGRDQGGGGGGVTADFLALREAFGGLAALIDQYPRLRDGSQFVFVPGPNDPGLGDILPAAPLAPYFTGELRRVLGARAVFATNPCRLRYHGREVVVFRHDLMAAMRRRVLVPPAGLEDLELHQRRDLAEEEEEEEEAGGGGGARKGGGKAGKAGKGKKKGARQGADAPPAGAAATQGGGGAAAAGGDDTAVRRALFAHLALTLLQQSHLCPLPLVAQPVHWRHDHALRLYPLPHAVVLADGTAPQAAFRHEGCTVLCPGSLRDREFSAYLPFGGADAGGGDEDDVEPSVLPGGPGADAEARRREARLRAQQEAEAARWAAQAAEEAAAAVAAAAEAPMDWLEGGGGGGGGGGGEEADAAAEEAAAADGAAAAAEQEEEAEEEEAEEEAGGEDEEMPAEPTTAEEEDDEEMAAEQQLPSGGGGGEGGGGGSEEGAEAAAADADADDGLPPAAFGSPVAPAGPGSSSDGDEDGADDDATRPVSGGEDRDW
jgi:hypothetical protein